MTQPQNATLPTATLDRIAARHAATPRVSQMVFGFAQPSTGLTWTYGDTHQPYFIASITKLYTVAMIMQLRAEAALTLDTRVADLVGPEVMRGLNVHDGHDYGPVITVRQLLSQTSGIPDYFAQQRPDGTTFQDDMLRTDAAWTRNDYLAMARAMPSRFTPGAPGKAQYSDTNYQLLGHIIEVVTSGSYAQALHSRILAPLGLSDTWLFTPHTLDRYDDVATVRHGRTPLRIPQTIASFPPDGALVSTVSDQLRFLPAFIDGRLFPAEYLSELTAHWNPVFSRFDPISYGLGVMRFRLPRWQAGFLPVPTMVGHSGAFGAVLYHLPERDLYVAGTVNQMHPRSLAHRILVRLVTRLR